MTKWHIEIFYMWQKGICPGKIIGFGKGIVHKYGKANFTIVYETVSNDLNHLAKVFEVVL